MPTVIRQRSELGMKKCSLIGFISVVAIYFFASSCQKDITLESPPSLEGIYEGWYYVITDYNNPQTADTTKSTVEIVFSDESYFFNSDNVPDAFCDPRGDYELAANNIELDETNRNCNQIAKEKDNPRGQFNIRRADPDSLIMIQQIEGTLKLFLLTEQ